MQSIFIHGLGQNSSSWNKTVFYMKGQSCAVYPDLSLFLNAQESTYANLYRNFSEYCNNFFEPLNLCGLSLGAVLALNYTIDNPKKVQSLVLIAAQYKMPKALLNLQNIIFRFMPETSFKDIGLKKEDFIKLTNSMMYLNFSKDLENISCPVSVICGEKDKANKKSSQNLAVVIPKSEIHFIENSGHEVNIDAPKELAKIIDDFYYRQGL